MGKNNKTRRATKKLARMRKQNVARKNKATKDNLSLKPGFRMLSNPFAHLSEQERTQVVRELRQNSERKYRDSLGKIVEMLHRYDPIAMLAILSFYGLTIGVGDDGLQKKDTERNFHQSHVEICQAFALQIQPETMQFQQFASDTVQEMWESLTTLLSVTHLRSMPDPAGSSGEASAVELLQHQIRSNTRVVRNWGFYSQVTGISHELYSHFDESLSKSYGFSASNVIALFKLLMEEVEIASTRRAHNLSVLFKLRDKSQLVLKFHELLGFSPYDAAKFIEEFDVQSSDRKALFFTLLAYYDLQLHESYEFSPSYLATKLGVDDGTVERMLDHYSYELGDLATYETEFIYLSNPIWFRPIIRIGDGRYFCALPQVFFSFIIPALDSLIETVDKEALSKRRASYLEDKIVEVVNRRFPESNTVSRVTWRLGDAQYETDLITFIDSHAIIVEAKSVSVSDRALRGAPERIKRHIEEILVVPNVQSKRLKCRLEELITHPEVSDELRAKLPVDLNRIHKVIRVSVSLEDFCSIQSNVAQLRETGWLPEDFEPCPTMTLADFETLFDFLEHPVQIIHYLEARQELESTLGYMGDELDLMGLYISTLFNIGDIGQSVDNIIMSGMSSPLDNYYNSKDAGVNIPKPQPKISPLFSGIMEQLEKRQSPRWTEIGVILNRFSPDDQRKLARMVEALKENVRKNWMVEGHKNMAICVPPKASRYAIAYVIYNDHTSDRRDVYIQEAACTGLKAEHVRQCLVIAKNVDRNDLNYHFIGLFE